MFFSKLRACAAILSGGVVLFLGVCLATVMALMGLPSANYCAFGVNWVYHAVIYRCLLGPPTRVTRPQLPNSIPLNAVFLVIGIHPSNPELFEQVYFALTLLCKRLVICLKWEHQQNLLGWGMKRAGGAVFVDRTGTNSNGQATQAVYQAFYRFFTADPQQRPCTVIWYPEGTRATGPKLSQARSEGWLCSRTLCPKPGGVAAILRAAADTHRPVVIVASACWSPGRTLPSWQGLAQLIGSSQPIQLLYQVVDPPTNTDTETVGRWLNAIFSHLDAWMGQQERPE